MPPPAQEVVVPRKMSMREPPWEAIPSTNCRSWGVWMRRTGRYVGPAQGIRVNTVESCHATETHRTRHIPLRSRVYYTQYNADRCWRYYIQAAPEQKEAKTERWGKLWVQRRRKGV